MRRVATEALCNLMPHPKMFDHLKMADTLKLFAAYAQLGEEDSPTAAAAIGCLAMGMTDKAVRCEMTSRGVSHLTRRDLHYTVFVVTSF